MTKTKSLSKTLLMAVLSILVVLAMMPATAFADESFTINGITGDKLNLGNTLTLTTTPSYANSTAYHIDWTSSDETVATVSKHKGVVTPMSTGTVVITATLRTGVAQSGTGGGNGSGNNTCIGDNGTQTYTLTIEPATGYGFQGTGGNSMKMLNVNGYDNSTDALAMSISVMSSSSSGYVNRITAPSALVKTTDPDGDDNISFGFTMSAGVNNFQPAKFNQNCVNKINIYDENNAPVCGIKAVDTSSANSNFTSSNQMITIYPDDPDELEDGETYKIIFGAGVCGNNTQKTLGIPVTFYFTMDE